MKYQELLSKNNIDFNTEINVFGYNKSELKKWKQEREILKTKIENLGENLMDNDLENVSKLVQDCQLLSLRISACYFSRLSREEILEIYTSSGNNNLTKVNEVFKKIDDRLDKEYL